jgi:hypothetical protein
MKNLLIPALAVMMLSACATTKTPAPDVGVAPPPQMPELPETLSRKAERLPDIADRSLGGLHRDGVNTDAAYNELAHRYNALVDAWGCVRQALNARDPSEINSCLRTAEPSNK